MTDPRYLHLDTGNLPHDLADLVIDGLQSYDGRMDYEYDAFSKGNQAGPNDKNPFEGKDQGLADWWVRGVENQRNPRGD